MRIVISWPILLLMLTLVGGCSWHNDLTALSTKNINLAGLQIEKTNSKGRVEGRSCQRVVVFFPIDFEQPSAKEAVDRALETVDAHLLLNAVLEYESICIPLIYGRECYFAEGDAYVGF